MEMMSDYNDLIFKFHQKKSSGYNFNLHTFYIYKLKIFVLCAI